MKKLLAIFVLMICMIYSVQMVHGQSVTINPATASICAGSGTMQTLTAIPVPPVGGYVVDFAWSNGTIGDDYIEVSPATTTTYTVTVTFNGAVTRTASATVTVLPAPTVTISTSGSTNICTGGSVTLTASASTSYQWYKDGTAIAGATSINYPASASGNYRVYGTVGTCSAMSAPVTVTVNPLPVASFTPNVILDECPDAITPFTADLIGPNYTYQWYQSLDGTPGSFYPMQGQTAATLIPEIGDFHYSVTITNTITGCTSSW